MCVFLHHIEAIFISQTQEFKEVVVQFWNLIGSGGLGWARQMLQLKVMILFLSVIISGNVLVVLNSKAWCMKEKLGLRRVQTCAFIEFEWLICRTILFIQPNLENDFAIGSLVIYQRWALECRILKCSIGKQKSRYHKRLWAVTIELVI